MYMNLSFLPIFFSSICYILVFLESHGDQDDKEDDCMSATQRRIHKEVHKSPMVTNREIIIILIKKQHNATI